MGIIATGAECWTESGRKAVYAGEIDGQKFVRIMMERDDEDGVEEWPSEKLTPVSRVFDAEPTEVLSPRLVAAQEQLSKLLAEAQEARKSLHEAQKLERDARAAAVKFPEIQTAVDFLEGRITHCVVEDYSSVEIKPLSEVLDTKDEYNRRPDGGLKMLALFGYDKGKPPRWAINRYSDGSGSWTTITPCVGIEAAQAMVSGMLEAALGLWRSGEKHHSVHKFAKTGLPMPQDWQDYVAAIAAERKAKEIADLKAKLADLEGGAA